MAKELEAEDIELKEYAFTPTEIEADGTKVIDYSGVEHDRIFLVNTKGILDKERPSWMPELDVSDLRQNNFLPPCVKDKATGDYYVLNNKTVYKMSLDILAATVDYYLKREREYQKSIGEHTGRIMLPRALKHMSTKRYDNIVSILHLSGSYKDSPELSKTYNHRGGADYRKQNNIVFLKQWMPLLEAVKGKKLDLNYSKQDYIDSYSKGEETSYGNGLCFNNLYEDYGVRIKKQNGSTFSREQLGRIQDSVDKVWKHYGSLKKLAADYGLKVSYADNCMQHARQKAIGLFTPYYNAIGVSFFDAEKQRKIGQNHLSDITLAHEVAHWLDAQKGKELHRFFSSDAEGTLENKIATIFKDEVKKRERNNKKAAKIENSEGAALGEYWFRTCECFARALEQSYAMEQGIDLSIENAYVQKAVFEKEIKPLVEELMKENARYFELELFGNTQIEIKPVALEDISKNTENKWQEDSLFDAIENVEINGELTEHLSLLKENRWIDGREMPVEIIASAIDYISEKTEYPASKIDDIDSIPEESSIKVDVSPITPEKSGTISEYLDRFEFINKNEIEKAENISSELDLTKPTEKVLPFSIMHNEEKGRVNIKFDTMENNPQFKDIIKELKSNGWKFAPSTKQWYPIGKAADKADDFANALQEKYSVSLNTEMEAAMDISSKKSPYDGIRFFDRNYREAEAFTEYFNAHLFELEKNAGSISNEDAAVILQAIGYVNNGALENRNNRLGLDRKENLVILTKKNSEVKTVTTDLKGLLDIAREQSEYDLEKSNNMLESYKKNNGLPNTELQSIFIKMYEESVKQSRTVKEKMHVIYDKYSEKERAFPKAPVLYQRNSYRGWEVSASKDFAQSVYFRPFAYASRTGLILMTGKEVADGFWQEKPIMELLHKDGWNNKKAIFEALSTVTDSKKACEEMGIEYSSSTDERLRQISVVNIDSGKDIKNEILEIGENALKEEESAKKIPELIPGEKFGDACAADVYKISDGVYQAALERVLGDGETGVQNYFVLDKHIVGGLPDELQELTVSFGARSVIENKNNEPYILRELIGKGVIPPRDDEYVGRLDEYISSHPLRYIKLCPVMPDNFEDKLRRLSEIDKEFKKSPFELGQRLISMVDEDRKAELNEWLFSKGCTSKENMERIFASWIGEKAQNIENAKEKSSGYLPRGEE